MGAPAKTNFAYSGQQSLYGCSAERQFYQTQIPKVPSCSRFKPIPSYLDENIDRICENSNKMSRPVSAKNSHLIHQKLRRSHRRWKDYNRRLNHFKNLPKNPKSERMKKRKQFFRLYGKPYLTVAI